MAKRYRPRRTPMLSAGVTLALALAACSGGGEPEAPDAAGPSPTAPCAAYAAYGTFEGAELTVIGGIRDLDADTLAGSFEEFAECTGVDVEYEGTGEFEAQLRSLVKEGTPPDIAFLPQPGLLQRFAASGDLKQASPETKQNAEQNWNPEWIEYGSHDGVFYAPPLGANVKSFVWYSPKMFAEAGIEIPHTLGDLKAASDKIAKSGKGKPWCAGIESQDATGWPATDWVEDFMLRTAGPETYDRWLNHEIPFDDPAVKEATDAVGAFLKNPKYVNGGFGGVSSIASTSFQLAGLPILDGECWMHRQASFYAANWPEGTRIGEDGDVFAFYLPAKDAEGLRPVLGAGEFIGAFSDEPHVMAFHRYLSSKEYIRKRAALQPGSWVTAAEGLDPNIYQNPVDRLSYETLQDPQAVFRFDASDLMPAAVGTKSFWRGMTAWINGAETDEVLGDIERSWPKS